jgi:hypothetical protein
MHENRLYFLHNQMERGDGGGGSAAMMAGSTPPCMNRANKIL